MCPDGVEHGIYQHTWTVHWHKLGVWLFKDNNKAFDMFQCPVSIRNVNTEKNITFVKPFQMLLLMSTYCPPVKSGMQFFWKTQVLHTNYSEISPTKLNQCPAVNLEQDLTIFPFLDRNSNMQVTPKKKKKHEYFKTVVITSISENVGWQQVLRERLW